MDRERREWEKRTGRGVWIDEIYTEDEDEARELADGEARRAARMFGCLLLGAFVLAMGAIGWLFVGPRLWGS